MRTLLQELRYSIRLLAKKPGFTAVAIVTLAAGIGLNTAIFSVINSVLLRPLSYNEPERLTQIWETWPAGASYTSSVSPNNFLDWRNQSQSFRDMSAYWLWLYTLTGTSEPTEVPGMKVSPTYFSLLGVTPQLGRTFLPDEDQTDKNRVAVISHGFWKRNLGGNSDVIGQPLQLEGDSFTIVGVLGADFRQTEMIGEQQAEVWTPLTINPGSKMRGNHYLRAIGRLKSEIGVSQAQAELTSIAAQLEQAYPETNKGRGINLVGLHEQVTGNIRRALLVLQFATGIVLLIACSNVANLLLARVAAREKEMAIRSALGGSRWQLVRMLLAESWVLALAGGVIGLILARWGVDLLVALAPSNIPRVDEIGLDGRVLVFTLVLSLVTVVAFGLVPAWQASQVNFNETLKESARGSSRGQGFRGVLVVAEIALTVILLTGTGLLVRSLIRMQTVDLGFNHDNLLTIRVSLLDSRYRLSRQIADYYSQLLDRVRNQPGVLGAAVTSSPPLIKLNNMSVGFEIEAQPIDLGNAPTARYAVISPDYFRAMGIGVMAGREFTEIDKSGGKQVAIINDNFMRRYFADADPIGKQIVVGRTKREIVGVVGSIRHESPADDEAEKIYAPHGQNPFSTMMLIIRAASDPTQLITAAQKAVWEGDPDAAVSTIATMDQALDRVVSRPRFNALLLGVFSVVALALALVGVFGVMSYIVTQNTREIGIRMALGAQSVDVLKLVVGQGFLLTAIGIGVGVAGALGLTRLIGKLLFGVTPTDPLTFVAVSALLTIVALFACYVPARRATKVDPMVALRYE